MQSQDDHYKRSGQITCQNLMPVYDGVHRQKGCVAKIQVTEGLVPSAPASYVAMEQIYP